MSVTQPLIAFIYLLLNIHRCLLTLCQNSDPFRFNICLLCSALFHPLILPACSSRLDRVVKKHEPHMLPVHPSFAWPTLGATGGLRHFFHPPSYPAIPSASSIAHAEKPLQFSSRPTTPCITYPPKGARPTSSWSSAMIALRCCPHKLFLVSLHCWRGPEISFV